MKGFNPGNGSTLKMKKGSAYKIMTKATADAARSMRARRTDTAAEGRGGANLPPRQGLNKMAERASGTGMKVRGKRAERATREAAAQRAARAGSTSPNKLSKMARSGIRGSKSLGKLRERMNESRTAQGKIGRGGVKPAPKGVNKDGRQAIGGVKMGGKFYGEKMVKPAPTKIMSSLVRGSSKLGGAAVRAARGSASEGAKKAIGSVGKLAGRTVGKAAGTMGKRVGRAGTALTGKGKSPNKLIKKAVASTGRAITGKRAEARSQAMKSRLTSKRGGSKALPKNPVRRTTSLPGRGGAKIGGAVRRTNRGIDATEGSPQKLGTAIVRVGSKLLPSVIRGGGKKAAKNVAKSTAKNTAKTVTFVPKAAAKTTGQKAKGMLKSAAKYTIGGYAMDKAINMLFPGKKASELTDAQKAKVVNEANKSGGGGGGKKTGSDPYAKAAKKDPNLAKFIKIRDNAPKGSEAYNAAQNRINRAYGVSKRHGVTESTATKGRTTVKRGRTPGIGERAQMKKDRAIGGRKQVDHAKSYITGKSKERKTKKDAGKVKERFYDAQGNLERKVKMKGDGKNLRKVKDTRKTADTVTKTITNKRTGRTRTKTRKRRLVGLGDKLAGLVGR